MLSIFDRFKMDSGNNKIEGKVEVDETVVGGQEEGVKGRKNDRKKLVVFAIEKKGKGVSRLYGKVIKHSSAGKKGKNFPDLHRTIMGFKGWLRGMHHHVDYLQAYIDEYCYRFNRSVMTDGIFDNLIYRMMAAKPITQKQLIH